MLCCFVLLLWLASGLNFGRHVPCHHFLLDGVVAPEAENFIGDLAKRRDPAQGAHFPFFFQFRNAAFHVYFHGKISKSIFLMSQCLPIFVDQGRTLVLVRIGKHRERQQDKAIKMIEIRFKNDRSA